MVRRLDKLLEIDRTAVDDKYSILEFVPQYDATETLSWATNIFIAADLSENRRSLSPYPAISIQYEFELSLESREFIFSVLDPNRVKDYWILPYYPHSSATLITSQGVVVPTHNFQGKSISYPYHEYWMVYNRERMLYGKMSDMTVGQDQFPIDSEVWIVPCYEAIINPAMRTVDYGKCRYGHELRLNFRMTADSEKAMTYHYDDFPFYDALSIPVNTDHLRHQSMFTPIPAGAHSYNPYAYRRDQTSKVSANYFLRYDEYYREDYPFRGVFMKGLGISAGEYGYKEKKYRLEPSSLEITYHQGHATASTVMREVAA